MPPAIARHHDAYIQQYFATGEKKLIGKPRKQTVVRADGSRYTIWLNLGEIPATETEPLRFIGRLRIDSAEVSDPAAIANTTSSTHTLTAPVTGELFAASTTTAEVTSLSISLSHIIEAALKNAQLEMAKHATEELLRVDTTLHKTRQALAIAEANFKAHRPPSPTNALTFGSSSSSLFRKADDSDDSEDYTDESHGSITYENVEIHERIADGGGSGAQIYSCSVDGWGCCMKEVILGEFAGVDLQGILNEVTVLEKLPYHKNLVRYLFHRSTTTSVQIFMRHYSCNLSQELRRRLANHENLFPAAEVARLGLDIANGIALLHSRKLLHRDLKSDNVFVTKSVDRAISYLTVGDFDTAKSIGQKAAQHTLIGTPGYMAPEVLQGHKYGFPVDVFSFGMVMYELLTHHRPYEDEKNSFRISQNIIEGKKPTMPPLDSSYADIVTLINKCLRAKPDRRPTIVQCKAALTKYFIAATSHEMNK